MNKEKLMILTLSALALAACSSGSVSDEGPKEEQPMEIRLSTGLDALTRAYTPTQSTAVADGQTIYAWADDHVNKTNSSDHTGDIADYLKGWTLTSSGSSLTGSKQYYSAAGNNLDVYAVHGTFNNAVTEGSIAWAAFTSGLTHTVAAAQNTGTGYLDSDLLYAVALNLARQSTPHTLTFKHLLSKIEVNVISGGGLTAADLSNVKVEVVNVQPTAAVTLSKTDATASTVTASGTPVTIEAKMTYDAAGSVVVGGVAKPAPAFAEAIVVPQTYATGSLLQVTLYSGATPIVLTTPPAGYTFDSGKRYIYNLTVSANELKLQGIITDWLDGQTYDIEAR